MNNIKAFGKFLDQPLLVSKFQRKIPAILASTSIAYTVSQVKKTEKEHKKEQALKTGITIGVTAISALAAPYIASKLANRALPLNTDSIISNNKKLVDYFIKNTNPEKEITNILEKSKEKILNLKEVKKLYQNLNKTEEGKIFLEKLIPSPQNISAKDIFSEIGYLSIFGAVPVVGGILGGIFADRLTDKPHWKEKIPAKIEEGAYQYLANIFMCNVGAGIALGITEKAGITSKASRAIGMTLGIITTGIVGGSKIANFISSKLIEPCFNKCNKTKNILEKELLKQTHKDRTPEILDIGLHTDDIATVSLLSGLKWIEPALPLMYTLSGYRAGIGYRN